MASTSERDAVDRPEPSSNQVRTINLTLQGGGAHGAFTWGWLAKRHGLGRDAESTVNALTGALRAIARAATRAQ
jgi:predicted acylesterase/phospholipase RssA